MLRLVDCNAPDSVTYATMIIGMIYTGYIPFLISTRNNPAAVAHLLKRTNARHVYMSGDHMIQSLANAAYSELEEGSRPMTYVMPVFEELYEGLLTADSVKEQKFEPAKADPHSPLMILHSSGRSVIYQFNCFATDPSV